VKCLPAVGFAAEEGAGCDFRTGFLSSTPLPCGGRLLDELAGAFRLFEGLAGTLLRTADVRGISFRRWGDLNLGPSSL
jgi:hypothetical protein